MYNFSYKNFRQLLMLIVFSIICFLLLIICSFLSLFLSKYESYRIWKKSASYILKISFFIGGIKIKVDGLEHLPSETAIFAADHRSIMDSLVLLSIIKRYYFCITVPLDYFPNFLFRIWIKNMGFISFFRNQKDEKKYKLGVTKFEAIFECKKRLKENQSLVIFPEGHHEKNRKIRNFHTGAVRFAIESKVPIIPVGIIGSENVVTPVKNKIHPGKIHIKFGRPIYYDKYYGRFDNHELIKKLTKELKEQVKYLIHHKV
jgi:1-acyl-sn-glycerol-3-phosphate acyltransferase